MGTWSSDLRWSDNSKAGIECGTEFLRAQDPTGQIAGCPAFSCDFPKTTDIKMLQCSKCDFERMSRCEGPANEDCPDWSKESSPWVVPLDVEFGP